MKNSALYSVIALLLASCSLWAQEEIRITKPYNETPFIALESTTGDQANIKFSKTGSTSFWDLIAGIRTSAASGTMSFFYNSRDIMTLRGDGKVGINTFRPNATLDVRGDLKLQYGTNINEISNDGNLSSSSNNAVPTEYAVKKYVDNRTSNYWVLGGLNTAYAYRGSNAPIYVGIGPTLTINKQYDDSVIEVTLHTFVGVKDFPSGVRTVSFQIRIDNNPSPISNNGAIKKANSEQFISLFAVFEDLPAGEHEIRIFMKPVRPSLVQVILDPGNFGGKIIAKETF
jgi:hypothetical protein